MLEADAPCDAAPGGEVRDWELWAAAPVTPSSRTVSKARAKSRKRSIIRCPPPTVPWPLLLTTDGVENKASVPFRPASRRARARHAIRLSHALPLSRSNTIHDHLASQHRPRRLGNSRLG